MKTLGELTQAKIDAELEHATAHGEFERAKARLEKAQRKLAEARAEYAEYDRAAALPKPSNYGKGRTTY